MSDFQLYLQLGIQHIADFSAYDHILFIVALCAAYQFNQWKPILLMVTAFTAGHSVALALATLRLVAVRSDVIEFLIPVTILFTALVNMVAQKKTNLPPNHFALKYGMALFFGLIHGLGFSNYLRELLGAEENIALPLLAFNIGLELGQLLIVAAIVAAGGAATGLLRAKPREWTLVLSGAAAGIALTLMAATKFW